jgi:hypothetical protein
VADPTDAKTLKTALGTLARTNKKESPGTIELRLTAPGSPGTPPSIRVSNSPDSGISRLPPETIQKVVRASYGKLKACYEQGLKQNPNLGLVFPNPEGVKVDVVYPIQFSPKD